MRNRKQPSWLQTASKGKKRVLAAVCILLVLGVLSPFVINGIVVGSAAGISWSHRKRSR